MGLEFSFMAENRTEDNFHHRKLLIFSFQDSHLLFPCFALPISSLKVLLITHLYSASQNRASVSAQVPEQLLM